MVQTSMGNENFRMAIMKSDVDNVNQMLSSGIIMLFMCMYVHYISIFLDFTSILHFNL